MNAHADFNEEDYFGDEPNLLDPDNLSGIQSIEDLDPNQTIGFDSLDPILLKEIAELVRKKVNEIDNPTTRSVTKLTHGIPLGPEDYLFDDLNLRINIDSGNALTCSQIAGIVREKATETKTKIHTRKGGTTSKIRAIKEQGLKSLGRDTYNQTQEGNGEERGKPHIRGKIEIGPGGISDTDFKDFLRIKNKGN